MAKFQEIQICRFKDISAKNCYMYTKPCQISIPCEDTLNALSAIRLLQYKTEKTGPPKHLPLSQWNTQEAVIMTEEMCVYVERGDYTAF